MNYVDSLAMDLMVHSQDHGVEWCVRARPFVPGVFCCEQQTVARRAQDIRFYGVAAIGGYYWGAKCSGKKKMLVFLEFEFIEVECYPVMFW